MCHHGQEVLYGPGTPRKPQDRAPCPSSNTAIASFDRGVKPDLWGESQDGRQMEEAQDRARRAQIVDMRKRLSAQIRAREKQGILLTTGQTERTFRALQLAEQ